MKRSEYTSLVHEKAKLEKLRDALEKSLDHQYLPQLFETLLSVQENKEKATPGKLEKYKVVPVERGNELRIKFCDKLRVLRLSQEPELRIEQNERTIYFKLSPFSLVDFDCHLVLDHRNSSFKRFELPHFSGACFKSDLAEKELVSLMDQYFTTSRKISVAEFLTSNSGECLLTMKEDLNFSVWLNCLENHARLSIKRTYVILKSLDYYDKTYNDEKLRSLISSRKVYKDCLQALRTIAANDDDLEKQTHVLELSDPGKQHASLSEFLSSLEQIYDSSFDNIICDAFNELAHPSSPEVLASCIPVITLSDCFKGYDTLVVGTHSQIIIKWSLSFDFSRNKFGFTELPKSDGEKLMKMAEPTSHFTVKFMKNKKVVGFEEGTKTLNHLISCSGPLESIKVFIDHVFGG